MPKIETLNQNNRISVGSPTPIRGSESARIVGEGLQDFGQSITRAATTMNQIYQAGRADEEKVALENVQQKAAQLALLKKADTISNASPDGKDAFKLYSDGFRTEAAGLIEGMTGDRRAKAVNIIMQAENSQADAILDYSAKKFVNYTSTTERETTNMRKATVSNNPDTVLAAIEAQKASLAGLTGIYSPDVIEKLKLTDSREFAETAVQSAIVGKQFDKANMLASKLGAYGDVTKWKEDIENARYTQKNRALQENNAYESRARDMQDQKDDNDITTGILELSAASYAERSKIIEAKKLEVASGQTSLKAFQKMVAADKPNFASMSAIGNGPLLKYALELRADNDPPNFSSRVMRDVEAGIIPMNDAVQLMKTKTSRAAAKGNKDPAVIREIAQADDTIKAAMGSWNSLTNETTVLPAKTKDYLQMTSDTYELVANGMKPTVAANKVTKSYYSKIATSNYLPAAVLPESMQANSKQMIEAEPAFYKKLKALRNSGRAADAITYMRKYQERLKAIQFLENGETNGRR